MKHKIVFVTILTLALAMLISSCESAAAPSPTAPVEASPAPAGGVPEYPAPAEGIPEYPAPAQAVPEYPAPQQAMPAYNPYPGPSESASNFIDWTQADALIQSGEVAEVYQAQTLHVTLVLKDGSVALTIEPAIDEVSKSIEQCGEACKDTKVVNQ